MFSLSLSFFHCNFTEEKHFKENYKPSDLNCDASIDQNNIPAPKSSFQQLSADFMSLHPGEAHHTQMTQLLTEKYLSGITKRVVFFEGKCKVSETLADLKQFDVGEKCHLIDQNEINGMSDANIKFESFKRNRRTREEEYNKLLQCLSKKDFRSL